MRYLVTSLAAGGLLCAGAFASNAWARPSYLTGIPNSGVNSCGTCHVNPAGGGARNSFGQDVQASLNNGPTWSALFDVDSDSDGQTNGEELGDPCGTWMAGAAAPRTTDISAPGDSASTSADPNTPACANPDAGMGDTGMGDTGMEMDAGMPMDSGTAMDAGVPVDSGTGQDPGDDDDGGCTCATPTDSSPAWGLLFGAVAFFGWRRRRSL